MKKLVFFVLFCFAGFLLNAQEMSYGLKAGVNFANMKSTDSDVDDMLSSRTAFHAGVVVEFKLSDDFSLQPELLYNSVGAKVDASSMMGRLAATPDVSYVIDYLTIPVMAKYYVAEGFSLELGPQIGFVLSSKMKVDSESEDFKDQTESTDFGLGIGAGYQMENGLFLNARYVMGLSNIAKDMEEDTIKNNVLQFSVGFKFN